jgi:glycosyltransferase involved in cell wall biosynthesis
VKRSRRDDPNRQREVVVVYKTLPHYRVDFFERLRHRLAEDGIRFRLIVGQPDVRTAERNDTAMLPWAEVLHNRYLRVGSRSVVWQPCLLSLRTSDLVVVEQASRLLLNPLLGLWRLLGGPRLAFWGHGKNLDKARASALAEWWKRKTIGSCDWWFAYTEGTAEFVAGGGYPLGRITVVQNAIDTDALRVLRAEVRGHEIEISKIELGISSSNVGLFVGSLYEGKRLRFLVEAADLIRQKLPDFELLIVGDGPDRSMLQSAASTRPWLHVLGARFGEDLARKSAVASVLLMPGLVGLAVLDAFALELPMITTAVLNHSPEIEYLRNGDNGIIVADPSSAAAYADTVVHILADRDLLERLRAGCREAALKYTVGEMVERFRGGLIGALNA